MTHSRRRWSDRLPSWLTALTALACLPIVHAAAGGEDWPQFRGPTGQGHSAERGLPLEWAEGRNVIWKSRVPGRGWSSPVVSGGRVWVTTATEDRGASLRLLAFDVETGRQALDVEVFHTRESGLLNLKDRKSTRLNSSHIQKSRMPSSA